LNIILTTINARYHHASFGLRCLRANLAELKSVSRIVEFTLEQRASDVVEAILQHKPTVIGIGVYIWNIDLSTQVVRLLKCVAPEITLVLGGPEVSFPDDAPEICDHADFIITGQGDLAFADLCRTIAANQLPATRIIRADPPKLSELAWPYEEYNDVDISQRLIYVEASRGCPFKCEFCLSSLDKTAWPFDLDSFLEQMDQLYQRGLRNFKFVDRTFNLKIASTVRILKFFLAKQDDDLFLHFELIPDRLPDELKQYLPLFKPGTLQFEIGVQSFNPEVQSLISRKQKNENTCDNLRWLVQNTSAHIHADLIFGLPGESLQSFAEGFNRLYQLNVHEIQLGILKRLRGTPISRHEKTFDLRFNPSAPYEIVSNKDVDFTTMQTMQRFARYWDMIANSGRFANTMQLFDADNLFEQFASLSDWIFTQTGRTHQIALKRLFDLLHDGLTEVFKCDQIIVTEVLTKDFDRGGFKGAPKFISDIRNSTRAHAQKKQSSSHSRRQQSHLA
jgi:radical SAM superfamily enzyme YgiQ (UPF0313 family)